MTPPLSDALDVSRRTLPDAAGLSRILPAEQSIAFMDDASWELLQRQLASLPGDAYYWLWTGLALEHRGQFDAACNHYAEAIERGCTHWRVGWYIARAAKHLGNLPLVDSACAAVLKANPEFWFARELPKHARGFYSQLGQDKRIEAFFKDNPPRTRRFVEVGAFDGVHYSNVRRMQEHHGWSGLCVEPVPKNFKKLSISYQGADVRCVQAAVSTQDGELDIHVSHYPHLPDWGSDVASLAGADQERWTQRYGAQWTVEKVPARRLSRLLDEAGIDDFDLLSIDAEGHDLEILQSLDFERFQPQLIVVEYGSKRDDILSFFARIGYSILCDNKQDLFAARITHAVPNAPALPATRNFTDTSGQPGYEEIQRSVERGLHDWIGRPAAEVGTIAIVGGYLGTEVRTFLDQYPAAEIVIFEPSRRYFPRLQSAYASEPRVKCLPFAVGETPGSANFHEGSLNGVGSLLPIRTHADDQTWIPKSLTPAESYPVLVVTLDTLPDLANRPIDLLWCEVQGAELLVLKGAVDTLRRCRCLFLEVATTQLTYDGQCRLADLRAFLKEHGFYLAGIGLCPTGNGNGNSVWIRLPEVASAPSPSLSMNRPSLPPSPSAAKRRWERAGVRAPSPVHGPNTCPNFGERSLSMNRPSEPVSSPSKPAGPWTDLVNPRLLEIDYFPLAPEPSQLSVDALSLFKAERFDLGAKVLYARHRALGVQNVWASSVYEEHIRAFSKGTFSEGDGAKSGLQAYYEAFHAILDSVADRGLDPSTSLVPVGRRHTPIDGAHRIAAAVVGGIQVPIVAFDRETNVYDWQFFRDRGMPEAMLDAVALEFARRRSDTFLLHLFPTARGRDAEVRALLQEQSSIIYEKSLRLSGHGPALLVRELYAREAWIGTWANEFAGARKDASIRFEGDDSLRVVLFRCDDVAKAKEVKKLIRALYGRGNYSCHINDTHEETVRLAQLLFNAQGVHFLNHASPRYFQRFHRHLELYRDWLGKTGADPELFCIEGSASLAAYGLRDAQDLDILHLRDADFGPVSPGVNSHNADVHHHTVTRDQILFDPEHHFHYAGLKFVALPTLRAMKAQRAEGKDLADVTLIDSLESQTSSLVRPVVDVNAKDAPREALRIYYVPNGDDYHIASLLDRLYTTVQPFGCRDVRDYIERRVLAYKTPDAGTQLWDEVVAMRPDLVYVESARNIEPAVLQRIRSELGIPVTMWFGDTCANDEFVERILNYAPSVTHQVTVDRHVALAAKKRGIINVEFVPFFGYDHYFKPMDVPKTVDILFSGKSYHRSFKRYPFAAERLSFVQRVDREFGARLRVVGEDWETLGLSNLHPARVPEWDVNRLNNESRIVLAYDAANVDGFTSCRTYHALLGRTFILLRKFPGAERLFINREHLVWFESEQEGIDLLHHYLARPEECDRIARAGYQHVRANGWMFSNVVRHLVHRGLARHSRSFEDVFAPFSKPLLQPHDAASPKPTTAPPMKPTDATHVAPSKPGTPAPRRTTSASHACLQQADRYFQQGKLAEAQSWLERVLDLDPEAANVWVASGNLLLQLGDFPGGIQAIQHAADLRPDHAPTLAALAAACVQAGRIEDFEKALGAALAINPTEPSAVRLLADLNFRSGQFQEAAHGYNQLIQQNPNDLPSLLALGVCFAKTGDKESARSAFNEVLRIDPKHVIALENLSTLAAPTPLPSNPASAAAGVPPAVELGVPDGGPSGGATAADSQTENPPPAPVGPDTAAPPLISAIISIYKSERFLRGCLEDLLQQTIADRLEIIVIDSGSPENERAIVEEFQALHPRIIYLRTERESIYGAWNRAVRLASAPYLTSANADDRHRPEALERLVAALEAHPECSLSYADCAVCENVHPDFGFTEIRGYYRWPNFDPVLLFRGCYVGPQPVWRRSLHDRYGLFDPSYRSAGDYEFWLRLVKAEKFFHLPEVLGLRWYAEDSLGHQNRDLTRQECDHARILHWPSEWGARPTQSFKTLRHIPAVEKQHRRNADLAAKIETLEHEKARLTTELARLAAGPRIAPSTESAPKPAPSSPSNVPPGATDARPALEARVPSLEPAAPASADHPSPAASESSTVPVTSLLPTDTNPEAFQHLLHGFDLIRENRFEEAQAEAKILEYHELLKLPPQTEDERLQRTLPLRPRQAAVHVEPSHPELTPKAQVKSVVVDSPIAALRSALSLRGWMSKFDAYAAKLKRLEYIPAAQDPQVSVVIIAHEIRVDSLRVLKKLQEDRDGRFEIVYVLNGSSTVEADQVRPYVDTLVELTENTGAYFARNVGAAFAKGSILFFLDDDAIPERGVVGAHLDEFRRFDVIAVRGAIFPKTQNPLNELAKHYYLGDRRFPIHADIEGNTSYLAHTFFEVGGWDDEMVFGNGGIDLAVRLLHADSDRRKQIYSPGPVVYHDYAANQEHLARKRDKEAQSLEHLLRKHPQFEALRNGWSSFFGKDRLVIPKASADAASSPLTGSRHGSESESHPESKSGYTPLITIAVPTYNQARFLAEAVQSALHQTYAHLEVVIVDDGSTDDTETVLRSFADSRIRCFTKEHSGGPATRNRCIAEARGEFIVWLDSDDFLLADTLALYVAELQRNPGLDVLYGNLLLGDERLCVQEVWTYIDYQGWSETLLADSALENRIPNVGTLVRTACYQRFGPYNPAFPRAHDYEFWTRLASAASVKSIQTEVAIYRRHEDSLSRLKKPADTRHEANALKGLLSRHSLPELFPFCYPAGGPLHHGDARALSVASLLMVKYGDVPAAIAHARKSVEAAELEPNVEILHILETLEGRAPASSRSKSGSSDEFTSLVDTAKRQFAAGNVQACAKACARLSQIRPEAPETMLLTAMSLRRWGAHHDAGTAFQHLVRRQCQRSYIQAAEEAESRRTVGSPLTAPRESAPDTDPRSFLARQIAPLMAAVFAPETLPVEAIEATLEFLDKAASASDLPGFLANHLLGQTPVFFAVLGLTEAELASLQDPTLAPSIARIRAALVPIPRPTPSNTTTTADRKPGYSFCIITGGSRPEKVARQIASIRALGLESFEILVGGNITGIPDDVRTVDLAQVANAGRLGKMRNALGRLAKFDHLVVSDDDILFDASFAEGLKRFGEGYDVMAVRILNTDRSRFWDWATTGGLKGSVLLDYWESDPDIYVTGGICVLKTTTLDRVQWDESRGFYQREDVDFSSRAKAAGFPIRFNPFSVVVHDDDRYSRVGRVVYQFDHLLGEAVQSHATRSAAETIHFLGYARRIAGSYPERQAAVQAIAQRLGVALDPVPSPASAARPPASEPVPTTPPSQVPANGPTVHREPVLIDWIGSFLDHGSLSHVNRELTRALQPQADAQLQCVGEPTPLPRNAPKAWTTLAAQMTSKPSRRPMVTVRHAWPPQWERPKSGALVVIQPWEFGSLPRQWVHDLAQVDEVWIPSEYVRRVYIDSGVPAEKVFVVPNGIDPTRFHPAVAPLALATQKTFKFLFVGGTIFRKGPDLLLEAFLSQFTAADDVCLVIKDFGGKDVYAGQTFEQSIRTAQARPNAPEILYLNEEMPPDSIPGLYTACDCLVHPYRGEGFGLPVLEAMACGLPVIVTAGGATDDFAPDNIAIRIPSIRKEIGASISGMPLVRSGWLLEPDLAALANRMQWVHDHRDDARSKGLAGSRHVHANWTWTHAAAIALNRAQAIAAQAPTSTKAPAQPRSGAIELPDCARVGHLGPAHELFDKKKFRDAWNVAVAALQRRPYHPEAYLLLGEIAKAVGDASSARRYGQQAKAIAPQWKPARAFLKGHAHGNAHPAWLVLPPELAETNPADRCRLSVCLIVKDEERFLAQCLQSIRSIASEIIVVDTGSKDRTIEIAREFGAQVHSFVWCDDFSAARNAALEHATGDWVLMLDADEQLPPDQHDNLRRDFRKAGLLGLRIPLQNLGAEAEGVAFVPRLFRNAPGLFYVSRIHEQIFSSILVRAEEWGLETALGTAQIKHFGYTEEIVVERQKSQRNLRLLRDAVLEFPDDANLLMNLGLEFVHAGDPESGIAEYERAFQALCDHPEQQRVPELRETLLLQYASALMNARRYSDIVRILESPVAKAYEPTASIHFALGLAYFRLERPPAAAAQIKECLAKRHLPTASPIDPEIRRAGPYHYLGLCLIHAGQLTEAEAAFQAALRDQSSSRGVRLDLARLYKRMARPIDALKVLHEMLDTRQGDPEVWRLGGEIALGNPSLLEFAIDWTGEAIKAHATQTLLAGQHGEALLLSGNPGAAIPFLRASATAGDAYHGGALCLAELATDRRPTPVPAELEQAVSAHFLRWFQRLTATPGSTILHQVIDQIRQLEKVLPTAAGTLRTALTEVA